MLKPKSALENENRNLREALIRIEVLVESLDLDPQTLEGSIKRKIHGIIFTAIKKDSEETPR